MARVKIDETILEDVALTMSGGRLCLRWAADAWDGTLDSAAELLGVADELRELDADDMTVALYAVRGLASLRMDAEHAAMEAVLCVDPMEVGAAEKLGQQIEQQSRELGAAIEAQGRTFGAAIEAQSTALGERIDGQAGADSVGCKPSCGMVGRRGGACADYRRNAQPQSPNTTSGFGWRYTYANGQRWHLSERKLPVFRHKRKAFCRIYDFNCIHRRKRSAQQHAAVAGRLPLEARGLSYTRKGAAI